jgi:hypothetical protein
MFTIASPYLGEILLDAVWTSGPMGESEAEVRDGLQYLVDSLDVEHGLSFDPLVADPCAGEIAGPFTAVGYDPAQEAWVPFPNEPQFDNTIQPERRWCVVGLVQDNLPFYEGRVLDVQGSVLWATGPESDPNIAASKALWVSIEGPADFPWPNPLVLSGEGNP